MQVLTKFIIYFSLMMIRMMGMDLKYIQNLKMFQIFRNIQKINDVCGKVLIQADGTYSLIWQFSIFIFLSNYQISIRFLIFKIFKYYFFTLNK